MGKVLKHILLAGCTVLYIAASSGVAHAAYPVHDATNYTKILEQLQQVTNQYKLLQDQYEWYKRTYSKLKYNFDHFNEVWAEQLARIQESVKKDEVFPEMSVQEMFDMIKLPTTTGNDMWEVHASLEKATEDIKQKRDASNSAISQSRQELVKELQETQEDIQALAQASQQTDSVMALAEINNLISAKRSQMEYILSNIGLLNGQQRLINEQADEQLKRNEILAGKARAQVERKRAEERSKNAMETEKFKSLLDYSDKKNESTWSSLFK